MQWVTTCVRCRRLWQEEPDPASKPHAQWKVGQGLDAKMWGVFENPVGWWLGRFYCPSYLGDGFNIQQTPIQNFMEWGILNTAYVYLVQLSLALRTKTWGLRWLSSDWCWRLSSCKGTRCWELCKSRNWISLQWSMQLTMYSSLKVLDWSDWWCFMSCWLWWFFVGWKQ